MTKIYELAKESINGLAKDKQNKKKARMTIMQRIKLLQQQQHQQQDSINKSPMFFAYFRTLIPMAC
jgi:predicted ribosome-associated RNA-binding protein Tma20